MPLPRSLSVMPRYLNPLLRPIAGYLPPLALLHHRGRRSGRRYETPVQVFRTPQGYVAAFVYSNDPEWARNLLTAGEGQMTRAGRTYSITNPRRLGKDGLEQAAPVVAAVTRALGVQGFLQFDSARQGQRP